MTNGKKTERRSERKEDDRKKERQKKGRTGKCTNIKKKDW